MTSAYLVLLTSYRDFAEDKEWEWLHNDSAYASALVFEPVEGNKAEMVVTAEWRSKVSKRAAIMACCDAVCRPEILNRCRSNPTALTGVMRPVIFMRGTRQSQMYGDMPVEATMCSSW